MKDEVNRAIETKTEDRRGELIKVLRALAWCAAGIENEATMTRTRNILAVESLAATQMREKELQLFERARTLILVRINEALECIEGYVQGMVMGTEHLDFTAMLRAADVEVNEATKFVEGFTELRTAVFELVDRYSTAGEFDYLTDAMLTGMLQRLMDISVMMRRIGM